MQVTCKSCRATQGLHRKERESNDLRSCLARATAISFDVVAIGQRFDPNGAWLAMPPDLQSRVPSEWVDALTMAILALGIAGRLVKQDTSE